MPSSATDRTTVVLLAALRERGEPSERVRARIALDVLASLPADTGALAERSAESRLTLGAVRLAPSGRAYLVGSGDATGAAVLLWEVFTCRESPPAAERQRAHEVADELHADLDDMLHAALSGRFATVGALLDALVDAAPRVAPHTDVMIAMRRGGDGSSPSVRPGVPWPRPPSVAPPPELDLLDDLDLAAPKAPAPAPPPERLGTLVDDGADRPSQPATDTSNAEAS